MQRSFKTPFCLILLSICLVSLKSISAQLPTGWKAHDLNRPAPVVVTPAMKAGGPPSDAIILFDGKDLSHWQNRNGQQARWKIKDGAMESVPNSGFLVSKESFGDCQLHVEFASPKTVKGSGQGRGNSGVFLMGAFEIQVLDSYQNATYPDGSAGSIYGQHPPLVNASGKPGEWQTFDIIFRRPRFSPDGQCQSLPRFTVFHNGVLVQESSEAVGPTRWIQHGELRSLKKITKGPVQLQDHGNPVRYRNIWIRPLVETPQQPKNPYDPVTIELLEMDARKLVGQYGGTPITYRNGKLFLGFAGSQLELVPHSKTQFGFTKSAGSVQFTTNEQGVGKSLEIKLDAAGTREENRKQPK
jgi:hypothetical protein